jgi:UDP-N-acetylglucosamine diphosphorylase/glucosamine-1-phosphate N-acetyltransferase
LINSAWIPTSGEVALVEKLQVGDSIICGNTVLAAHLHSLDSYRENGFFEKTNGNNIEIESAELIKRPWEIFSKNGKILRSDFDIIKSTKKSEEIIDVHTIVYGKDSIFLEEGVDIKAAILNASEGPIYLGKDAQIQEGSIIKGPVALLNNSVVNMGAKIRPDTTIGPFSKVGGEVNNCVIFGYSNKAHDGFLGNSVIGEWCNLGADTNNSNLKNNYGEVKVFGYEEQKMVSTGLQFCGLIMGDHSKTSINSMLNTGTVVGVGCNIFDGGFPPKHIVSFSWGGSREGFELYDFEKFIEAEKRVFERRKKEMSANYIQMLRNLYDKKKDLFITQKNPIFGY